MICQKCGNNNPDGASFCRFCGNRLRNEGDPNTPNMAHARPQVPAYGQPQASDYVQPQTPDYVQPQAPGYGQPQAPGYGQPQAPGYGQPQAAGYGQPQAPGYGQPQAPGYGGAGAYGSGPRMGSAYTDPYGRSPYGAAPDGRAYPAPGTSRPVSRWLIAVIAEAAVLLMVLVIASTLFHQAGSVDRKAGKYFVSLVNGNYKKAFSYLNLKKDKFINPDQLELAMGGTDFSEVDNYYIQDYRGLYDGYYGTSHKANELGRTYVAFYRNKGASYDSQYYIQMAKSGKGGKWYVSSDSLVVRNAKINVPRGAAVTVDDIEVPEKYAEEGSNDYGPDVISYTIPQLFSGAHYISVKADGCEELRRVWYVSGNGDSCSLLDLRRTRETMESLQAQAASNMQRIYQAILNKESFDSVADLFTSDPDQLKYIREDYERLAENMHGDSYWVTSMSFQNLEARSTTGEPSVRLSFHCAGAYQEKYYDGEIGSEQGESDCEMYFNFQQENGSWVQNSLGCQRIYF